MDAQQVVPYDRVKDKARMRLARLLEELIPKNGHRSVDRAVLITKIRQVIGSLPGELNLLPLGEDVQGRMAEELFGEIIGIGPLDPLMMDPEVTEIMVNGPDQIFVERAGKLERAPASFKDAEQLRIVIERLLDGAGASASESEPCVDVSLADGSRVNVVLPPISLNGPALTIRKRGKSFTVEDLVSLGTLTPEAAKFLQHCMKARINIVIAGGTSSGKTTLVSVLSTYIPAVERIVTIENIAELELPSREHWVRLVARGANPDGRGEISLRTLVRNALRMRPDRIILGEARGGEALDIIQAMQTGHDGVLSVLHANTPEGALERLETLMLMSGLDLPLSSCRHQVALAVELIIQISRFPDGVRRIEKIVQVTGAGDSGCILEELFTLKSSNSNSVGRLEPTGILPRFNQKFSRYHEEVSPELFRSNL